MTGVKDGNQQSIYLMNCESLSCGDQMAPKVKEAHWLPLDLPLRQHSSPEPAIPNKEIDNKRGEMERKPLAAVGAGRRGKSVGILIRSLSEMEQQVRHRHNKETTGDQRLKRTNLLSGEKSAEVLVVAAEGLESEAMVRQRGSAVTGREAHVQGTRVAERMAGGREVDGREKRFRVRSRGRTTA